MRRGVYGGPRTGNPNNQREWEEYDPRNDEYYSPENLYTSGPGLYLPQGDAPYSIRRTGIPYKLFVSGIHSHTTEEGIRHIFNNYGRPISVMRTRNKLNQPIAFVEFETQLEADNAIVELDRKPPLNWQVAYAMVHRNEDRLYQNLAIMDLNADMERQTPLYATQGSLPITLPRTNQYPTRDSHFMDNRHSSMVLQQNVRESAVQIVPCAVCEKPADQVCTVCSTRYCSVECQKGDWPTHRESCQPPPPLAPANGNFSSIPTAAVSHPTVMNQPSTLNLRAVPTPAHPHLNGVALGVPHQVTGYQGQSIENVLQNNSGDLISPHSFMLKGIKPLEGATNINQPEVLKKQYPSAPTSRSITPGSTKITVTSDGRRVINELNEASVQSIPSRPQSRLKSPSNSNQQRNVNLPNKTIVTPPPVMLTTNHDSPRNARGLQSPPKHFQGNQSPFRKSNTASPISASYGYSNGGSPAQQKGKGPRNYPLASNPSDTPIPSPARGSTPAVTPDAKIYAKEFSKMKLKPPLNGPAMVTVCFSKSPDEFYIQFECFHSKLEEMMRTLQKCVLSADPILSPLEGMPCLALFPEDRLWYRALALKIFENGKNQSQIGVRFVDYGNTVKMPNDAEHFRMMELHLSENPFFAVKVKLGNVRPVNGSQWESDVIQNFKLLTENNRFLIEFLDPQGEILCVRLQTADHQDVAAYLVQKGQAASTSPPLKISDELDAVPPANASELTKLVAALTLESRQENVEKQTVAQAQLPPVLHAPNSGITPTRAASRQAAIPTTPRTPSTPLPVAVRPKTPSPISSSERVQSNSIIQSLEVGKVVCLMAHQNKNNEEIIGSLLRTDDEDLDIDTISNLSTFLETLAEVPDFKPSIGCVVAAFSQEHGVWYRGCVTKKVDSTYVILYVDFGNFEEGIERLKPIPSSFIRAELAVKMTVCGSLSPDLKEFIDKEMTCDSTPSLEIVAKDRDGKLTAKLAGENVPSGTFKVDSWMSLIDLPAPTTPLREISCVNWEPGFSCNVIPMVAEDIDRIYVQPVSEESIQLINVIQAELEQSFASSPELTAIPAVGSYVASIFPDDMSVYRAKIEEINETKIKVFFIDYGNTSVVTLKELRKLPESLFEYPACCKRIALARVIRPASISPETLQGILTICLNEIFNMLVLPSVSGLTECTLTKDGEILNQTLADTIESLVENSSVNASKEMPLLKPAEKEDEPSQEPVAVDNTLGRFTYDDCKFMDLPEGQSFQALILECSTPESFMLCCADAQITAKLDQLQNEMAEYASGISLGPVIEVNLIYMVKYPDGKWYRAVCVEATSDGAGNSYGFIQVDGGTYHCADVESVRRIPTRFVNFMPFLAQQGKLVEVESIPEVSEKLINRFSELLPAQSVVSAEVVRREELSYVVRLPEIGAVLSSEGLI